ncbi:hypothetical protein TWF506_006304 [Arthrobotrys conoides]|uniref:Aminoglycoside phosphotransferase domain-containing protein n=1 Tax=Arthrobotrys conoides TaxID=74498 RepID=A0AAN8RYP0_9PEZI
MALHEILTDAELAQLCHNEDRNLIDRNVVKISNEAVIKFGYCRPDPEEAENLRMAAAILDPIATLVRVPKFYRYFTHESRSYLVMEYIEGRTPSESEYEALAEEMNGVLRHFRTLPTGSQPGPFNGGISRGYFWDRDRPNFQTIEQLEDWINTRLLVDPKVSFQASDLVFSHLDVALRNIIRKADGTLYLIDWEAAGYYPKCFELAALEMVNTHSTRFECILREKIRKDLGAHESAKAESVTNAWYRSEYTYFKPTAISNRPPPFDVKAFLARYNAAPSKELRQGPPISSNISCVN